MESPKAEGAVSVGDNYQRVCSLVAGLDDAEVEHLLAIAALRWPEHCRHQQQRQQQQQQQQQPGPFTSKEHWDMLFTNGVLEIPMQGVEHVPQVLADARITCPKYLCTSIVEDTASVAAFLRTDVDTATKIGLLCARYAAAYFAECLDSNRRGMESNRRGMEECRSAVFTAVSPLAIV